VPATTSVTPPGPASPLRGTATTGWSYGVYELELRGGHVVSHTFTSMAQLEELYA
jgi:hypothetical protein